MNAPPVVLTIAGFDPSSGAGITADLKTIAAHGCYGISCITALTVQSTVGVREVSPVPAQLVQRTLQALAEDLPVAAIHIGMLGSGEVANVVADFLGNCVDRSCAVVLDPILRSSSGADFLDAAGREVLLLRLLPLATVVTPNLDEASVMTGHAVSTLDEMGIAADSLHQLGARAVVVKGGHLQGNETIDLLSRAEALAGSSCTGASATEIEREGKLQMVRRIGARAVCWEFRGGRIDSRATHGTGCAFASALACNLALGQQLPDAVGAAKAFVAAAISHAYPLGHGHGPMNHLFRLEER